MYTRARGGPEGASSGFGLRAKTLRGQLLKKAIPYTSLSNIL